MHPLAPQSWTDSFYPAPRSGFDRSAFQRSLDEIAGTVSGKPILRLVWGAEEETLTTKAGGLLITVPVETKEPRYLTRVKGKNGKVRIRRWIIEEWQAPEQFADPNAFVQIPGKAGLFIPSEIANEQRTGRYNFICAIGDHEHPDHDDTACEFGDFFCFGAYREPNTRDLEMFRRARTRINEAGNNPDPFKPVSAEMVALHNKRGLEMAGEI